MRTPQGQPQSNINAPATQLTSIRLDWTRFGYQKPSRTLPTQVKRVLGTDLEDEVANSLWNQYNRANEFLKKNGIEFNFEYDIKLKTSLFFSLKLIISLD